MVGSKLGHYEIVRKLGSGGMGDVYAARDTKLDREVALKVLPPEVATDPERRKRFEREARAAAALCHPGIVTLYAVEEADDECFITMELVEGKPLAQLIEKGPVKLERLLDLAVALADALATAHEQGVTHRDLKPLNIIVTPDGAPKVLDFGLAKVAPGSNDAAPLSTEMPTASLTTGEGRILGTPAYMSPEQAEGKPIDPRTDIFSLGVVLYEMATGRRPFEGDSSMSVISAVLKDTPPSLAELREELPARLVRIVHRCLIKDPRRRYQTARDLASDLEELRDGPLQESSTSQLTTAGAGPTGSGLRWGIAGAVAALAAAAVVWTVWLRPAAPPATAPNQIDGGVATPPATAAPQTRFTIQLPTTHEIVQSSRPALSPDGRRVVFSVRHGAAVRLYVRDLDAFDAREIPGTDGAAGPFFSPDGKWVGFYAGQTIKKVSLAGEGGAIPLAEAPHWRANASWGPDDQIVVGGGPSGLWSLPAAGGKQVELTKPDTAKGEQSFDWPQVLPDGRVLFAITRAKDSVLAVFSRDDETVKTIIEPAWAPAHYLPTGHLVFIRPGALVAAPFDLEQLTAAAAPTPILPKTTGYLAFSAAGTLADVHLPKGQDRALVQVDRAGQAVSIFPERTMYRWPRLSPDGKRLAVGSQRDIWVIDLDKKTRTRLRDEGGNTEPTWTADGQKLIYSSSRSRGTDLYWQSADGSGSSERLHSEDFDLWPTSCSPDGTVVAFYGGPSSQQDVWVVNLAGGHKARRIIAGPAEEKQAMFSPDGHWLAYISNETGRREVYVRPYPELDAKWSVSTDGGINPVWAPDGGQLYYRRGHQLMVVDVESEPNFSASPPRVLFEKRYAHDPYGDQSFDVFPDGKRFAMVQIDAEALPQLRVTTNWLPELERLVPR